MLVGEKKTAATPMPGRGARFVRVALHLNPYAYLDKTGATSNYADEAAYNDAIVAACRAAHIDAIAVTDHFEVSTARSLCEAAEAAGIQVFPAFEAQTAEGVHLLVFFDPGTPEAVVQKAIGACGVVRDSSSSPIGKLDVPELSRMARREWGAICVAAHATTNDKGILRGVQGQARMRAWQAPDLLAASIPAAVSDLGEGDRAIFQNTVPQYRRPRPMAALNARDVNRPEDLSDPACSTLIKMSEVSTEALRQAFLDPLSRIRLNSDAVPARHTRFTRLAWEGGFLGGVALELNENLNVLIGGRGAGKSCVIESLRYVLEQPAIGPEAKVLHESIVRHVLGGGTKITLHVRVHGPSEREYVIERTVPHPSVVRDATGKILAVRPRDVLEGVEIYGQHEISELTKSPDLLTLLLDRFAVVDERVTARRATLEATLRDNRAEVARLRQELAQTDERLEKLPALEERLRAYEAAGLEEQFKERSSLVPEEPIAASFAARLTKARTAVNDMSGAVTAALRSPYKPSAVALLPHGALLMEAEEVLVDLAKELTARTAALTVLVSDAETKLHPLLERWQAEHDAVEERYAALLRTVEAQKVDAQTFIALRKQIEGLRVQKEERTRQEEHLREALERRRALVTELEDVRAAHVRALTTAAEQVSRALAGVVRVHVVGSAQRGALEDHLRERLGGPLKPIIDALLGMPDLSLRELAATIAEGAGALRKRYGFTASQSERLAALVDDPRLELEELDLPPVTQIDLNVRPGAPAPLWRQLGELSTGQKATAILLLLLLEADTPLVIDQPEDDLDNSFISDKIVPKIKAEKQRRQFLFSSHNANIPVLGDAELIIGLQATADAATVAPDHLGSIDRPSIRDLASEVLEGGREAFELRREKYDF